MREINTIVIHCSDSEFGDAALIDQWHKQHGWHGIGYHFVIGNCYPDEESFRLKRPGFQQDGVLQNGRPIEEVGAHAQGRNEGSIGICLIGKRLFSSAQFATLCSLVAGLLKRFPNAMILGHYEIQRAGDTPKSCPNLDMDWTRSLLM